MTAYRFDDRNIQWHKLGDFEHFVYSILDIDRENNIADVIFKFEPHQPIVLHRHKVLNKTLVIQGEHRLYEPSGDLKEVRPVGSYTSSPANPDPHRECGGDEGAVVFFSIRGNGNEGILYELLDDQQNLIGTITMQDLIALHETDK
jgi:quercetin dioxygenase-like cupin family protein